MRERMTPSQNGFVKGCRTHINIMRLMEKCRELQKRNQRAAVLFIDFKAAYNNVPLDPISDT